LSPSSEGEAGAHEPVIARPASTVIVLRDGPSGGIETFMVRRDPLSRFAADAFVFPGGTVASGDWVPGGVPPCTGLTVAEAHRRLGERGGDVPHDAGLSLALYVAAVRELYEEAGIMLARPRSGPPGSHLSADACEQLSALRPALQRGERTVSSVAEQLSLDLVPEELVYFSHWITPIASPRRYDTRFFIVEDRPGQTASHCGIETVDGQWLTPSAALRRSEAGEITLVAVTVEHLRALAQHTTVAAALTFARQKPIRTVLARRDREHWDLGSGVPW
jgi:8-oxo-dGTP pyrophosphatase MutT (NUDIX family)